MVLCSMIVYKCIDIGLFFFCLCNLGGPRCYSANDPELNSTAWFVKNIGVFVTYLSLEDLNTFVTASQVCP